MKFNVNSYKVVKLPLEYMVKRTSVYTPPNIFCYAFQYDFVFDWTILKQKPTNNNNASSSPPAGASTKDRERSKSKGM